MTRLSPSGTRIEAWDNPRQAGTSGPRQAAAPRKGGTEYLTDGGMSTGANGPRQAGANGEEPPIGFDWQQEPHRILEVCNRWRVHARWWEGEQAVWREYFKVATDRGLLCLIYHDLQSGEWYLSRIYD